LIVGENQKGTFKAEAKSYVPGFTCMQWLKTFEHGDPLTDTAIEWEQQRLGWRLSPQLRELYKTCNGVRLRQPGSSDSFTIVSLERMIRVRSYIYGDRCENDDAYGPANIYVFGEYGDTDAIGLVVESGETEPQVVDCFHETFAHHGPETIVAASVFEFLENFRANDLARFWLR
jgi:hypothetical protein